MSLSRALAVIPVRMASTRLPGKPLLPLGGRPMVQWVHAAALASGAFERVLVATDDERIANAVTGFGGDCVMTSSMAMTGTERVAEAAAGLLDEFEVVANVQGDQPFVSASDLHSLLQPFQEKRPPEMTTLAAPLSEELLEDSNTVKVVTDLSSRALYFSRSPIPAVRSDSLVRTPMKQHLGLYAFRSDFLATFAGLSPSPLEQTEQLEQLRALEHGYSIRVCVAERATIEINTREDYERAISSIDWGARL